MKVRSSKKKIKVKKNSEVIDRRSDKQAMEKAWKDLFKKKEDSF